MHWRLSFGQLPVQPVTKISSKWQHFLFSVVVKTAENNSIINNKCSDWLPDNRGLFNDRLFNHYILKFLLLDKSLIPSNRYKFCKWYHSTTTAITVWNCGWGLNELAVKFLITMEIGSVERVPGYSEDNIHIYAAMNCVFAPNVPQEMPYLKRVHHVHTVWVNLITNLICVPWA